MLTVAEAGLLDDLGQLKNVYVSVEISKCLDLAQLIELFDAGGFAFHVKCAVK